MIRLALFVVVVEAGFCLVLSFQRPSILSTSLLWAIQLFKLQGGGPFSAVCKGTVGSMAFALATTLFRITRVRRRIANPGLPTLADRLMLQTRLLEASLIGIAIFLFIMLCQLHAQVCKIAFLKSKSDALKKQAAHTKKEQEQLACRTKIDSLENTVLDLSKLNEQKLGLGREEEQEHLACRTKIDSLESTVLDLKKKIEDLQDESNRKDEEIRAAEANAKALQKQSEGFLLEYDRLLEDNQSLRSQLSNSVKKKS